MLEKPSSHYERPDEELLEAYKATGDMDVYGELYQRYMSLIYGVCLKYLKNRADSQDMVMHLFEKLSRTLLKHDVSNFKGWLYVAVKNECMMHFRSSKKDPLAQPEELILAPVMETGSILHPDNENQLERNLTKLEDCLKTLQQEQQTCVKLFYLEKRSYKDISDITEYDLKKVKSYIQNGKRNLKICIETNDG